MKGKILDFSIQSNSGAISGEDGERYNFDGADWSGDSPPTRGMSVDFSIEDNQAKEIYLAVGGATASGKNKTTAGLLAIFLGHWGFINSILVIRFLELFFCSLIPSAGL